MQLWWESSGAAFMARQHLAANLYDRLSTRPFLTQLEKVMMVHWQHRPDG
jgi:phosphoinositide-3-kinase regulatory subunit 4